MVENVIDIGKAEGKHLGVFSKIKKIFETRYTVDGRMLQEKAKLEKIQVLLSEEQQKLLFDRLQKSVKRTIITDIIVGSAVTVGGVLLIKNRDKIGQAIQNLAGKEIVELSPEQWAERIKAEAKHVGLVGSLKNQNYHAGDWIFHGKKQGRYQLSISPDVKAYLDPLIRKAASTVEEPDFDGGEVAGILNVIAKSASQFGQQERSGINILQISSPLNNQLGDAGKGLVGIAYTMRTDPGYIEGYYDNRGSPLIWQILIPQKLARSFEEQIDKKPNIVHETMRAMLSGLFEDFSVVQAKEMHVYKGGLSQLLNKITQVARPKVLTFSPPVGG